MALVPPPAAAAHSAELLAILTLELGLTFSGFALFDVGLPDVVSGCVVGHREVLREKGFVWSARPVRRTNETLWRTGRGVLPSVGDRHAT